MTTFTTATFFINRCIELAKQGAGKVAPNPMVGAVIVYNNKIIGEGYHAKYGGPHAEVNAINQVKDKSLLKEASIYVSLEPCAHQGKTPPCADLIIKHKIPNVIIGMQDPFAKVDGAGIKKLEQAGCTVSVGVLEKECRDLNKAFITYHEKKRPYIILKWAQTDDGFIDKIRTEGEAQQPNWITDETCRTLVHKWRAENQAIMVGTNTAQVDNPKLNVRTWSGQSPLRIVLDRNLRLDKTLHLFDQSQPTIVINEHKTEIKENLEYLKLDFDEQLLSKIMKHLFNKGILSIIIEGGKKVLDGFIEQNLWDEARIFTGAISFNTGLKAPYIDSQKLNMYKVGNSKLTIIYR